MLPTHSSFPFFSTRTHQGKKVFDNGSHHAKKRYKKFSCSSNKTRLRSNKEPLNSPETDRQNDHYHIHSSKGNEGILYAPNSLCFFYFLLLHFTSLVFPFREAKNSLLHILKKYVHIGYFSPFVQLYVSVCFLFKNPDILLSSYNGKKPGLSLIFFYFLFTKKPDKEPGTSLGASKLYSTTCINIHRHVCEEKTGDKTRKAFF